MSDQISPSADVWM